MKKISIIQSNYIPWKGYFDIILNSDVFVVLDDVQFTKNDWRNRNLIKTVKGLEWLTIPVKISGKFGQRICETEVHNDRWVSKHIRTIQQNYSKAPYFSSFFSDLQTIYLSLQNEKCISDINQKLIEFLCRKLGATTKISKSTDYFTLEELDSFSSNQRVLEICKKENATAYISGPAAKDYIVPDDFVGNDIQIFWADYSNYPVYPQLYGAFEHGVSIIDLLFNAGTDFNKYLKGRNLLNQNI